MIEADPVSEFVNGILTRYPTLTLFVVLASLVIGLANAGQSIETLKRLWKKWVRRIPTLDTTWQGEWKDPDGHVFSFVMRVEVAASGVAKGEILWKLIGAPKDAFVADKIGHEGIEYVSGTYDRDGRVGEWRGESVSNKNLLATDHYKLQVLEDGVSFVAMTRSNAGKWDASAEGKVIIAPRAR